MKDYTLVFGASLKPERYSHKAVLALREKSKKVFAFGLQSGNIADVEIKTELLDYEDVETVTLYVNPKRQKEYYNYILSLNPRRVIFNPGTENKEFEELLSSKGVFFEVACTLVLLATNQY